MTDANPPGDDWTTPIRTDPANAPAAGEPGELVVDIAGYEGPLDVLLALARTQKVDLAQVSILALVEQYLAFINEARRLELEIAADYLVMAAWLAFLKSKLLIPKEEKTEEELSAEDMARHLAYRLKRLEIMRQRANDLMNLPRLGRDVFQRGFREAIETKTTVRHSADLIDLLKAYARQRQKRAAVRVTHHVARRKVWSIKDARRRLENLVGLTLTEWVALDTFLEDFLVPPEDRRTIRASSFGASLEMAREGELELRQDSPFAPIYLRTKAPHPNTDAGDEPETE